MSLRLLKIYLNDIGKILVRLSSSEERELIEQYKSGNKNALEILIRNSQYIVFEEILYFVRKGTPILDLLQTANLSLIESLIRYCDQNEKSPLKNYLHRNIYRCLQNYLAEYGLLIKLPANVFVQIDNIKKNIMGKSTCFSVKNQKPCSVTFL